MTADGLVDRIFDNLPQEERTRITRLIQTYGDDCYNDGYLAGKEHKQGCASHYIRRTPDEILRMLKEREG